MPKPPNIAVADHDRYWDNGSRSGLYLESLHREDGPAWEVTRFGIQSWHLNGKFVKVNLET